MSAALADLSFSRLLPLRRAASPTVALSTLVPTVYCQPAVPTRSCSGSLARFAITGGKSVALLIQTRPRTDHRC